MNPEIPDLLTVAVRLERLVSPAGDVDLQVRGLGTTHTVEARAFVVRDERGVSQTRHEMEQYAPSLTLDGPLGNERLWVSWRTDSSPRLRVEQRELPLG